MGPTPGPRLMQLPTAALPPSVCAQALEAVRETRPSISPHIGMLQQLLTWEDILSLKSGDEQAQSPMTPAMQPHGNNMNLQLPPLRRQRLTPAGPYPNLSLPTLRPPSDVTA